MTIELQQIQTNLYMNVNVDSGTYICKFMGDEDFQFAFSVDRILLYRMRLSVNFDQTKVKKGSTLTGWLNSKWYFEKITDWFYKPEIMKEILRIHYTKSLYESLTIQP